MGRPHVGSVRPGARGTRWGGVGLTRVWVWEWGGAGRGLVGLECELCEDYICPFKQMRSNGLIVCSFMGSKLGCGSVVHAPCWCWVGAA